MFSESRPRSFAAISSDAPLGLEPVVRCSGPIPWQVAIDGKRLQTVSELDYLIGQNIGKMFRYLALMLTAYIYLSIGAQHKKLS